MNLKKIILLFALTKGSNALSFITVVYPFDGNKAPQISFTEGVKLNLAKGIVDLNFTIDGKKRTHCCAIKPLTNV